MTHMKVQMAPTTWRIKRKGAKFVLRSNPGKQTELSMPVSLVLKNILKITLKNPPLQELKLK